MWVTIASLWLIIISSLWFIINIFSFTTVNIVCDVISSLFCILRSFKKPLYSMAIESRQHKCHSCHEWQSHLVMIESICVYCVLHGSELRGSMPESLTESSHPKPDNNNWRYWLTLQTSIVITYSFLFLSWKIFKNSFYIPFCFIVSYPSTCLEKPLCCFSEMSAVFSV